MTSWPSASSRKRSHPPALARRAAPYAKLIELTLAFGLMGLIWFGECAAIEWLQAMRCPPTAFLSGSPRVASIFVMVTPAFAAIGPGFIVANLITGRLAATRRFFDGDAKLRQSADFRRDQAHLRAGSLSITVVALTIAFVASLSQICLTPKAIFTRPTPLSAMKVYPWSAVRSVTTFCVRAYKGGWNTGYLIGLPSGATVDIMGGTAPGWRVRPQVFAALRAREFRFDASKVSPDCGAARRYMLSHRP